MDDYNRYVTAVNKIFDYIEKMKAGWNNLDNKNYIESVEEFKSVVTTKADLMKQPPTVKVDMSEISEAPKESAETQPTQEQQEPAAEPTAQAPVQQEAPAVPPVAETPVAPEIPEALSQQPVALGETPLEELASTATEQVPPPVEQLPATEAVTPPTDQQEVIGIPEIPSISVDQNPGSLEALGE